MGANRSLARCPCIRLVWLLAHSEERGGLAPGIPLTLAPHAYAEHVEDIYKCVNVNAGRLTTDEPGLIFQNRGDSHQAPG